MVSKTKKKLTTLLIFELLFTGATLARVIDNVVDGSYGLALIYATIAIAMLYLSRQSYVSLISEVETDAYLEGYKRGLRRGRA